LLVGLEAMLGEHFDDAVFAGEVPGSDDDDGILIAVQQFHYRRNPSSIPFHHQAAVQLRLLFNCGIDVPGD
jgi:hypothetical protein